MNLLEITQPLQTIIQKAFFLPAFTKVRQYCTNSIVFNETVKLVRTLLNMQEYIGQNSVKN